MEVDIENDRIMFVNNSFKINVFNLKSEVN